MKSITNTLQAHLSAETTTLATCWKLTRTDGIVQGFTDHDTDLLVQGQTYAAQTGFTPTAISTSSSLNVDNLDVQGMLDADTINEEQVMAGRYDFAEIEIFQVNYHDPDAGKLILRRGWLGEITLRNKQFVAEVRGLTQKLSQQLGELYSAACRTQLGDEKCKVNMASYSHNGTIDTVVSNAVMTDASRTEENGYFSNGKLTFISGSNQGLSREIKAFANGEFVLVLPMPYEVSAGDAYTAQAGCDKNIATCAEHFDNAVNFRGEPHVPGMDRMLETSATRSEWE
jgi:uncharacterized phage protein (TIGR02218 family)